MENKKISGNVNSFQRDFLEANLKGTNFRGSKIVSISNKYIHTENASHLKKGVVVSFQVKEETLSMQRTASGGDTEADRF